MSLQQLQTLGLGKEVTLQVVQTSYYVIRLGATNIEFATPSGTVKHYIPEFNGGYYSDYCNPCEIDNLGQFKIPKDATSATISGKFGNSEVPNTASVDLNLLSAGATISLARQTLTQVEAIGSPSGGTFSYSASTLAQNASTIALANGVAATDNPNTTVLTAPEGDGSPTPGGLTQFTAKYSLKYSSASKSFKAAAFGMSCYMIALESDYGTPPKNCTSLTYNGLKIAGSVKNPAGLAGTYCRSFIFNVKLQGSAQLSTGDYIHYNVGTKTISVVDSVTGSDGTALVAGRTVARDKAIIFKKGILVDVDNIGYGLLANDTGGAIKGYRLDLFNGAGVAVCEDFSNPIEMSVCETSMAKCPGSVIK